AASQEKIGEQKEFRTGPAENAKESLSKSSEPQMFSRKREIADLEVASATPPLSELSESGLAGELSAQDRSLAVSRSSTAQAPGRPFADAPAEDRIAPASVAAAAIASVSPERYY